MGKAISSRGDPIKPADGFRHSSTATSTRCPFLAFDSPPRWRSPSRPVALPPRGGQSWPFGWVEVAWPWWHGGPVPSATLAGCGGSVICLWSPAGSPVGSRRANSVRVGVFRLSSSALVARFSTSSGKQSGFSGNAVCGRHAAPLSTAGSNAFHKANPALLRGQRTGSESGS